MKEITCKLIPHGETPLYEQLYQWIAGEIQTGRLREGERLPSRRALSEHLNISRNTVETAYGLLVAEGYLRSIPRSGFVVCPVMPLRAQSPPSITAAPAALKSAAQKSAVPDPAASKPAASAPTVPASAASKPAVSCPAAHKPAVSGPAGSAAEDTKPFTISFSTDAIDTSLFPYSSWARIMKEIAYENPDILQKGHYQGDSAFRATLADFLHQYRGVDCDASQIVIGAGMEFLLNQILQLLPLSEGVALENPGYMTAYHAVRNSGHPLYPVGLDTQGMNLENLRASGAKIAYVTPSHQFPTGTTMPAGRRTQLISWANEETDRYILEDDYDSEFRYATRPIPAMQSLDQEGSVIYLGSFNRTVAPAIRVAYMVLPPRLLSLYQETFSYSSCTVSRFEQQALNRFIGRGLYGRHLRREQQLYRKRCLLLTQRLKSIPHAKIYGDGAGLHFLLTLPKYSEQRLIELAAQKGIQVQGLSRYYHGGNPPPSTLVIGFGGCDENQIEEAVRRLAEVLT